ncbi:DNA polymerase III subunit gamma/tau [Chitinilyticum piscinae]|uniref:DNA polymerase III subunit gamma/tau n=1 Tax=Chitinilyticum piscinae TaxID=2866724 RepID=A0A8J7FNJ2_9NEIS|nr:DNA polymerase III subunit gamma/tau [Chitinilyticum piscinae]MBE9609374.1 DNA polymerase III subunit gamma/tau [Chitinilyticum piscinae]
MAYQVLARKWRPRNFAQLVGQEHVIKALANAFANERLHHAYLLTGTRGVGKTTIARIMAKALNCETGVTAEPCGVCSACTQIDAGRFVDLLEIDAASNTGIDNIREVLDNAQYSPTAGRFKVYIIDEVHMLSKSAFNAMLKTLEEPPGHVKFILATTDPQKVPVTVLSRCLQFSLRNMTPQQVIFHLGRVLDTEQITYEAGALNLLGHAAHGSMRDALSLLDQAIAYGAGQVEEAGVRAMLGAVDQSYLFELLDALIAQDGARLLAGANAIAARGLSYDAALQELAHLLHQISLAQLVPAAIADDLPIRDDLLRIAAACSPEDMQLYYQIAIHGRNDLALAPDEYAGFTMTLLRMLAFAPVPASRLPAATGHATQAASTAANVSSAPAAAVETAPAAESAPAMQPGMIPVRMAAPEKNDGYVATEQQEQSPPDNTPEIKPEPTPRPSTFDGDWPGLLAQLRLGAAGMLAQHAELLNYADDCYYLRVAAEHQAVATRDFQEKLREAISEYFGRPQQIRVDIQQATAETPAQIAQRERAARQDAAIESIQNDPFVQTLVQDFGGTVIADSIRPV